MTTAGPERNEMLLLTAFAASASPIACVLSPGGQGQHDANGKEQAGKVLVVTHNIYDLRRRLKKKTMGGQQTVYLFSD